MISRASQQTVASHNQPHSREHAPELYILLISWMLCLGIVMVYSASMTSRPSDEEQVYLSRHLTFLTLSTMAALLIVTVKRRVIDVLTPYLFWGSLLLVVLVLIPGIGHRVNGAQRWIRLGGMTLQPSELMKLMLPLYLADLHRRFPHLLCFHKAESQAEGQFERWYRWIGFAPHWEQAQLIAIILLSVGLVLLQPDLGTAMFLLLGSGLFLFAMRWPLQLFSALGGTCLSAAALLMLLRPYQWKRITGFLSGLNDLDSAPYQVRQSILAIGSGGLWGTGLGQGTQKLSYLPEAQTDFLLAVVGEELGLLGMMTVFFIWVGVYLAGLQMLKKCVHRPVDYVLGWTYLSMVVMQAVINAGVVLAVLPPKGISHPLLSYGGSSLIVTMSMLAMVYRLSIQPEDHRANSISTVTQ